MTLKRVLIGVMLLGLSACASHTAKNIKPSCSLKPLHPITDETAFQDSHRYLYEPPHIYRTWINARVTRDDNQVMSAHFRYWVASQGRWNVPLETEQGKDADLFTPAG